MTQDEAKDWIKTGGYAYDVSWPATDCIVYMTADSTYYWGVGSTHSGKYSPLDLGGTWEHSPSHTDHPPR